MVIYCKGHGPYVGQGWKGLKGFCEVHGFEGLRCRSFKVSQVLGRQMSKVEEASGLIMRFQGFPVA